MGQTCRREGREGGKGEAGVNKAGTAAEWGCSFASGP